MFLTFLSLNSIGSQRANLLFTPKKLWRRAVLKAKSAPHVASSTCRIAFVIAAVCQKQLGTEVAGWLGNRSIVVADA